MTYPHESIHLRHLPHPDDEEAPARLRKRAALYFDLASFGSFFDAGETWVTPIPCPKRPNRSACNGLLETHRRDVPAGIDWQCPSCGWSGFLSGWEGTDADLTDEHDLQPTGSEIPIPVEPLDLAALRAASRREPRLRRLAYSATSSEMGTLALVDPERLDDDLDALEDAIKSATSRTAKRRLRTIFGDLDAGMTLAEIGLIELPEPDFSFDVSPFEVLGMQKKAKPAKPPKRKQAISGALRIKVTLRDVKPPVWRRLVVPAAIELPSFHQALQASMGWFNCHLHSFRAGGREWSEPDDWGSEDEDERGVQLGSILAKKGDRMIYTYDFGDDWRHDILVEEVLTETVERVTCVGGKRACPPEDIGGPWGYAELKEALADPTHERHDELAEWIGRPLDPEEFDVDDVNADLARMKPVKA